MGRGLVFTGTTGNVTASGGTLAVNKTGLPNAFNLLKFKSVPSAGSGASTIEVMQKDTLLNADLVIKWKATSGNLYDPMDDSSGTPAEMPATDPIAFYDDEDLTGEFHMKFTNNDSVDKTYAYEGTYEEVPVFDSGRVMTIQKAELLGDVLYFGGRTNSEVRLTRSGTTITIEQGAGGATAALIATLAGCTGLPISTGVSGLGANVAAFLATPSSANLAAAVTGETGTGALVFASSPALTTPDIGAATGASLAVSGNLQASGTFLILGNPASTGAMFRNSGTDEISVQNHNNTALGDLVVRNLTVTGALPNYGITINYLDWASTPQSVTF